MLARPILYAALPLTVLSALALALGVLIGRTTDSWQIMHAPREATPVERTAVYFTDAHRGLTVAFRPVESLIRYEPVYAQSHAAAISPDRRYIVQSITADQQRLVLIDLLTGTTHTIGPGSNPTWSPDGRHVAYTFIGRLAGVDVTDGVPGEPVSLIGDIRFVNPDMAAGISPLAWSPDSTRLAVEILEPSDTDIYTVRPDGSELANITGSDRVRESYPVWSPDGTRIAYIREESDGERAVYIMDADGSNPRLLVEAPGASYPVWSPDGTRIAYVGQMNQRLSLIVIDVDGESAPVALTPLSVNARPVWSPDGHFMAYYNPDIHIIDVRSRRSRLLVRETHMMLP